MKSSSKFDSFLRTCIVRDAPYIRQLLWVSMAELPRLVAPLDFQFWLWDSRGHYG